MLGKVMSDYVMLGQFRSGNIRLYHVMSG